MGITLAKDDYAGWTEAFLNVGYGIFADWYNMPKRDRTLHIERWRKKLKNKNQLKT